MPKHIIIYRDGVADNQFQSTVDSELVAFRGAVELRGSTEDHVKISIIVCQKRHHTRLAYQSSANGNGEYLNPCVGLVVDAQGSDFAADAASGRGKGFTGGSSADRDDGDDPLGCIVGSSLNEFYLNSHAAVLGTSKPTKYVLLHDEIGLKVRELVSPFYLIGFMLFNYAILDE